MKFLDFYSKRISNMPAPNEKGEVSIPCLFHKDTSPSLSINLESGKWKCFAASCVGHKGGGYKTFDKMLNGEFSNVDANPAPLDEAIIDGYHKVLLQSDAMLETLTRKRGLTMETIKSFKLGFDSDRVWIPVRDKDGAIVNVRKYKPGASRDKMIPYGPGYNKARLFPVDSLESDWILLCEGEMDCLVALQQGYPAMTTTGGADTWREEFSQELKGKKVVICYDADGSGKKGASAIAIKLLPFASEVRKLQLPLPGTKDEKDITNYFVDLGHSRQDFDKLLDAAELVENKVDNQNGPEDEITPLHLSEIGLDSHVGKRVRSTVLIAGKDLAPFQVPYHVAYSCEMGEKFCDRCGICRAGGQLEIKVPEWDPNLLQMVNVHQLTVEQVLAGMAKVPMKCRKFRYEVKEYCNLEAVKAIPEIDFASERSEYVIRNLFYLGHGLETNHTYEIEAVVMPEPKTQYATAVIYQAVSSQDNIEKFELLPAVLETLVMFRVANAV